MDNFGNQNPYYFSKCQNYGRYIFRYFILGYLSKYFSRTLSQSSWPNWCNSSALTFSDLPPDLLKDWVQDFVMVASKLYCPLATFSGCFRSLFTCKTCVYLALTFMQTSCGVTSFSECSKFSSWHLLFCKEYYWLLQINILTTWCFQSLCFTEV